MLVFSLSPLLNYAQDFGVKSRMHLQGRLPSPLCALGSFFGMSSCFNTMGKPNTRVMLAKAISTEEKHPVAQKRAKQAPSPHFRGPFIGHHCFLLKAQSPQFPTKLPNEAPWQPEASPPGQTAVGWGGSPVHPSRNQASGGGRVRQPSG